MLTAIRIADGAKVIGEYIEKDPNASYKCPTPKCGKTLIHHRSKAGLRIGHFAHKAGYADCPVRGEKLIHVRTKLDIYEYIRDGWGNSLEFIEPEFYIADGTIRPDVYLKTKSGTRIGIEVQASELTLDEIRRRTMKYHREGVYVLWVLPFKFGRFYERLSDRWENLTTSFYNSGYIEKWVPRSKLRLHAFEQFIYWAYMKTLIMWDVEHKYSEGFIAATLSQHIGEETTYFNSDGQEQVGGGRRAKSLKVVDEVYGHVKFSHFKSSVISDEFAPGFLSYAIPPRHILHYSTKNKMERYQIWLPEL